MRLGVLLRSDDVASSQFVIRHKRPSLPEFVTTIFHTHHTRREASKASSRAVRILDILCRVKVPSHQLSRFSSSSSSASSTHQWCYAWAGSMWRVLSRYFPTRDHDDVWPDALWSVSSLLFFFLPFSLLLWLHVDKFLNNHYPILSILYIILIDDSCLAFWHLCIIHVILFKGIYWS